MLLLLSASVDRRAEAGPENGVLDGWNDALLTEERPMSARLVPDEERWNIGWLGRDMESDCLCPERDRPWPPPENGPVDAELDRFMADDGCGIAVFTFMPPSV